MRCDAMRAAHRAHAHAHARLACRRTSPTRPMCCAPRRPAARLCSAPTPATPLATKRQPGQSPPSLPHTPCQANRRRPPGRRALGSPHRPARMYRHGRLVSVSYLLLNAPRPHCIALQAVRRESVCGAQQEQVRHQAGQAVATISIHKDVPIHILRQPLEALV
jgi:hypothetical protein